MRTRAKEGEVRTLKRLAPFLAVLAAAAIAAPWLMGPACPRRVVIATGSTEGNYFASGQRYREILSEDGVTLDVRSTAGSVENKELLLSDGEEVSLAIIQGGVAGANAGGQLETIASLYLEPVWVFYRGDLPLDRLTDLRGKRIAVDRPGSGTRALALHLLAENDVATDADQKLGGTRLVDWGGTRAAKALRAGEIDAAFFVISPQSPIVRQLLEADDVQLLSFRRAAAYQRKYPFLSSVTLHEGMLDLKKNVPSRDIVLLAPAANLVARRGMHDALIPLILDAVTQVHEQGGFMEQRGAFPTLQYAECPVNAKARRYFKSGRPLFYRVLPFRLAVWLDQVKLVVIPLFTLLLPLLKAAPPVYRWRIRSSIYRWYRVLREIDLKLKQSSADTDFTFDITRLRNLDDELSEVSVPLSYMEEFYNLRLHVAYLLNKLLKRQQEKSSVGLHRAA
jgi:TRAP transporter TAXI family solute receptor